jgi:hypothetical protein
MPENVEVNNFQAQWVLKNYPTFFLTFYYLLFVKIVTLDLSNLELIFIPEP